MARGLRFWLPTFVWAVVIFAFSSFETVQTSKFYWQDFILKKTAHVIEYGVFFVLLYRMLRNTTQFSKQQAAVLSFLVSSVYGISDEFHQSFVPGREARIRDVAIDAGGAILSWVLLWKWLPKAPTRLVKLARSLQLG